MQGEGVNRIGDISTKIREAIRKALPSGPEQFMTVMVPGKVVNYGELNLPQSISFADLFHPGFQTIIPLTRTILLFLSGPSSIKPSCATICQRFHLSS